MGYGEPVMYGLSLLSQLGKSQIVWSIRNYGLQGGIGYREFDCIRPLDFEYIYKFVPFFGCLILIVSQNSNQSCHFHPGLASCWTFLSLPCTLA